MYQIINKKCRKIGKTVIIIVVLTFFFRRGKGTKQTKRYRRNVGGSLQ